MTVEPRIEDLLASIRRAIEDDDGSVPRLAGEQAARSAASPVQRAAGLSNDLAAAAGELRQLRERISRTPAAEAQPARPGSTQRASTIVEAIQTAPQQRAGQASRIADRRPEAVPGNRQPGRSENRRPQLVNPTAPASSAEIDQGLLSERSAQAVQTAFGRLAGGAVTGVSDRQVEDMTREMLRGMLKSWLDQNLPALVERLVREEIERVARTAR